ncbi:MAG TPA: CHASE3 domain-containing protein [Puia sp.]|jgi:signal transduction histidine kinase|nr:CHASE3 domain-containing protein [Puia sp.]
MKTVIRKFASDLRIRVGYGTAFFLLLLSYVLTLYANSELLKQARLVDSSNKIILQVEGLISSLKDAETGMRGYLLMKDESFLEPYVQSKQIADSIFRALQSETLKDPDRQDALQTMGGLISKKYQLMDSSIENYRRHHFEMTDRIEMKGYFDKEIMDRIRSAVKHIYLTEQSRLKERSEEMASRYYALNTIIVASLALAILMAIYGFMTYSRENKARREADERVFEYQEQLKQRISELDKANKELIQMRSIEKFASTGRIARTIAHEVRNPLTNINLAVDQLKIDLNGNLEQNPGLMLEMISRNSLRINQLITDLLNSTKFTELVYKRVSVNQLLDETLELAKDRIQLNNITVTKNYAGEICDIAVDVERMRIAFLNIIVNAIEAMEPGKGILQLKTLSRDHKCVVVITDNGPGIDKESQSKLFEAYFTTKTKGTGLGLTNTQNIILNHSGHISMESEPGIGTSFTITLDFV